MDNTSVKQIKIERKANNSNPSSCCTLIITKPKTSEKLQALSNVCCTPHCPLKAVTVPNFTHMSHMCPKKCGYLQLVPHTTLAKVCQPIATKNSSVCSILCCSGLAQLSFRWLSRSWKCWWPILSLLVFILYFAEWTFCLNFICDQMFWKLCNSATFYTFCWPNIMICCRSKNRHLQSFARP